LLLRELSNPRLRITGPTGRKRNHRLRNRPVGG
jgi:hypothetical protein